MKIIFNLFVVRTMLRGLFLNFVPMTARLVSRRSSRYHSLLIKGERKNRYGGLKKKAKLVGGVGEKKGKLASIT